MDEARRKQFKHAGVRNYADHSIDMLRTEHAEGHDKHAAEVRHPSTHEVMHTTDEHADPKAAHKAAKEWIQTSSPEAHRAPLFKSEDSMSDFKKIGEIHHRYHGHAGDMYLHTKTGKFHHEGAAGDGPDSDGHESADHAVKAFKSHSVPFNQRESEMSHREAKAHAEGFHFVHDKDQMKKSEDPDPRPGMKPVKKDSFMQQIKRDKAEFKRADAAKNKPKTVQDLQNDISDRRSPLAKAEGDAPRKVEHKGHLIEQTGRDEFKTHRVTKPNGELISTEFSDVDKAKSHIDKMTKAEHPAFEANKGKIAEINGSKKAVAAVAQSGMHKVEYVKPIEKSEGKDEKSSKEIATPDVHKSYSTAPSHYKVDHHVASHKKDWEQKKSGWTGTGRHVSHTSSFSGAGGVKYHRYHFTNGDTEHVPDSVHKHIAEKTQKKDHVHCVRVENRQPQSKHSGNGQFFVDGGKIKK